MPTRPGRGPECGTGGSPSAWGCYPCSVDSDALHLLRSLSEHIRQLARDLGARFIDAEALLRRAISALPSDSAARGRHAEDGRRMRLTSRGCRAGVWADRPQVQVVNLWYKSVQ